MLSRRITDFKLPHISIEVMLVMEHADAEEECEFLECNLFPFNMIIMCCIAACMSVADEHLQSVKLFLA